MQFTDFVRILLSNPEFKEKYDDLSGEEPPEINKSGPLQLQCVIDSIALHNTDDEFEKVFKSIENDVSYSERQEFFDYFYQTITWDGYDTKLQTESSEQKDHTWDPEFHIMLLESGKRISWLCTWIKVNHSPENPRRTEMFKIAAHLATSIFEKASLIARSQSTIFHSLLLRKDVDRKVEIEGEIGTFCSFIAHLSRYGLIDVSEKKLRNFILENFTKNGGDLKQSHVYKTVEKNSDKHKRLDDLKFAVIDAAVNQREMEMAIERLFALNTGNSTAK